MGNAIMSFYSALIDLLGRCAPEMHVCIIGTVLFQFRHSIFSTCSVFFAALFSSSTRGKVKLCVFAPSCALWCPQKI